MTKNEILIALSESENTKFGKEEFAIQSFPQKVFSSVWAVESEVNNGGFSQYFLNSSAETAAFVAEGARSNWCTKDSPHLSACHQESISQRAAIDPGGNLVTRC